MHEFRRLVEVETVERSTEHRLAAPGGFLREPALGQQAQDVLVLEAAHLPARVQSCQEGEHLLVEERIARFDRGVHRDAIALGIEQVPIEMDTSGKVEAAVERMPALDTVQI